MIQLKITNLEKILHKKIIPFTTCLGIDTARRSGWTKITTSPDYALFDYGYIDLTKKDLNECYDQYIEFFSNFIRKDWTIVIEDAYCSFNKKVFQKLSRFGMIIYTVAHLIGVKNKYFIGPSEARTKIGLIKMGNKPKEEVHKEFVKKFKIDLKDPDIIDACILAINGILI